MKSVFRSILAGAAIIAAVALAPATAPAYIGEDCGAPCGQHMGDDCHAPCAKQKGDDCHALGGQHLKKMAKELHLSAQQKQQVKDILEKNKTAAEPLMKQHMAERKALRSLIHADVIDEAAIRAQSAKIATVQADMAVHRARVAQEIRAVLTPEQVAKCKEVQAQRDKKMEERCNCSGKRSKRGK